MFISVSAKYLRFSLGLLFLLIFPVQNTLGQTEHGIFNHITVEDGLSNSLVFEMTQDSAGLIWLATQDGLNRFDGYSFKIFRSNDSIKTVEDSWITCLKTDRNGDIWFGTRTSGIGKIDNITGEFSSFKERMQNELGEFSLNIQNIFLTREGELLIATWGAGLLIYNINTSEFKQYLHDENDPYSISENRIYSVYQDSKGNIWAGSQRKGLNKLEKKSNKFSHINFLSESPNEVSNNFVLSVLEDHKKDIWIGTFSNGLFKISAKTEEIIRYNSKQNISGTRITKIFEDSQKDLWVCTNGEGIFKYRRENDEFINFRNNPMNPKSLNRNKVWSVMEDNTGLLWFGTLTNGINQYDRRKDDFKWITRTDNSDKSILSNYIKDIYFDRKGNLWLGTSEGLSIINKKGSIKNITQNEGLSVNQCLVLYEDDTGKMWIGTWGGGINIYNPSTESFEYIISDGSKNTLADNYLKCIVEKDGKMFFGTERGLNEYDPVTGRFKLFIPVEGDSTSISYPQISNILIDSRNNFWVGTQRGLNLFYKDKGTFKRISLQDSGELPQRNRIRALFEDSRGYFYIGTMGAGFAIYDPVNERFKFYTDKDGLSDNTVYEILEDDEGYLWLSTNNGLSRFDRDAEEFKIYRTSDGLPNNEFNGGAAYKDSTGILYFGGVDGLTYFTPLELKSYGKLPDIAITRVAINGKDYNENGFYNSGMTLTLPYDSNYINIYFAATDYRSPELNTFRYKLEGLNSSWITPEDGNVAVFTNLGYGEYVFRVQGSNKDGIWNRDGKKLNIVITPAWWQTVYAKTAYAIAFIFLMFGIYRLRVRTIWLKEKQLEKLVNERTLDLQRSNEMLEEAVASKDKLFSIIAHDLKNPFMSLLGFSEILIKEFPNLSEKELKDTSKYIYESATSVHGLLQNLLDWSRIQLDNMEFKPEAINIQEMIDDVYAIYRTSAEVKSISLINKIPSGIAVKADNNMIHTVFRNIISNSVKFTLAGGYISAESKIYNGSVEICIEDNGIGMDEDVLNNLVGNSGLQLSKDGTMKEKGTGLGAMLYKEFINKNDGKLNITSIPGTGTKIIITLPRFT